MLQKTGVSLEMQNYLWTMSEHIEVINWDYLTSSTNENFKEMLTHLYPEQEDRAKLLNPWSYIWSIIFEHYSSYFWVPKTDDKIDIDWLDYIEWIMSTWYARLLINPDGITVKWTRVINSTLQSIKANSYYYDWEKEYFIKLFSKEKKDGFSNYDYFILVETFDKWNFERNLFKLNNLESYQYWEQVPLETLPQLEGLAEKLTITWLDRLIIEKRIDHWIINKIKTIWYSIDRKIAEAEKNFIDYTEQFHVFSNLEIPDDAYTTLSNWVKKVDFDKLGKVIMTNDLNWTAWWLEIVKNTNNLLTEAIAFIDKQIRQISSISWIALHNFGIETTWGNDSWASKIASNWVFYKKIDKIRDFTIELFSLFDFIYKTTTFIEFTPVVTSDLTELIDEETKKLEVWITSKKLAIMKIHDVDETEALKILEEISNETEDKLTLENKFTNNDTSTSANENKQE